MGVDIRGVAVKTPPLTEKIEIVRISELYSAISIHSEPAAWWNEPEHIQDAIRSFEWDGEIVHRLDVESNFMSIVTEVDIPEATRLMRGIREETGYLLWWYV